MDNIYIKDKNLIIEVPMEQERSNPYDEFDWTGDNIIAVITPDQRCSDPTCGFAYRIDMSYKGKADQHTSNFYDYSGSKESFQKLCEKLQIEIIEYEACKYCGKALYGCFTWSKKGPQCFECEMKEEEGDLLEGKDFYELMQTYRNMPVEEQKKTAEAFEKVKDYIRRKLKK